jgi:hypothetical protein
LVHYSCDRCQSAGLTAILEFRPCPESQFCAVPTGPLTSR